MREPPHPGEKRFPPFHPKALARPTQRANPSPEVTDPFCRLPLSTLLYSPRGCSPWRPDAVIGTAGQKEKKKKRSPGVSWIVARAPNAPLRTRYPSPCAASPANPLPRREGCQREQRSPVGACADVPRFVRVTALELFPLPKERKKAPPPTVQGGNESPLPFRHSRGSAKRPHF